MSNTKKTNKEFNRYFVTFINTYKLENIGTDYDEYSCLTDVICANNIFEAYKIANDILQKINSINELQKYAIKEIEINA